MSQQPITDKRTMSRIVKKRTLIFAMIGGALGLSLSYVYIVLGST
jgi:uncharacterized membrane protein YsdA (DUF1294 family)